MKKRDFKDYNKDDLTKDLQPRCSNLLDLRDVSNWSDESVQKLFDIIKKYNLELYEVKSYGIGFEGTGDRIFIKDDIGWLNCNSFYNEWYYTKYPNCLTMDLSINGFCFRENSLDSMIENITMFYDVDFARRASYKI